MSICLCVDTYEEKNNLDMCQVGPVREDEQTQLITTLLKMNEERRTRNKPRCMHVAGADRWMMGHVATQSNDSPLRFEE